MGLLRRITGPSPGEMVADVLQREMVEPGTEVSIQPQVDHFWSELRGSSGFFSPRLIDRVWVANRCIQLNAQQIAQWPLRFTSTAPQGGFEPAWVTNPDPNWYPNGIGDAMHAIVRSLYGWGDAFLFVSEFYATGWPATWTVLDASVVDVDAENGRRKYRVNGRRVDENRVVQITRDPGDGVRGTSALRAYSAQAWGAIGGSNTTQHVLGGGTMPPVALRPKRKQTREQAERMQEQWVSARARYGSGVPAILPVDTFDDPFVLNISPKDLVLLELQEFNSRAIASAFGVPALLLNMPMAGSLVYQNPQALGEFWVRFELNPISTKITNALSQQMLPKGNAVEHDASGAFAPLTEPTNTLNAEPATMMDGNVTPLRPALGGET